MYFNDEQNRTNIDNEFSEEKKFNFNLDFLLKNKLIIGIILVIIILIIIFIIISSNKKEYFLVLEGSEDIIIYKDSEYVDAGFKAYDNKGNFYNDAVEIYNPVNTAIVGEYTITYTFNNIVKTRTISVVSETKQLTYLILSGDIVNYLKVGDTFEEPGYTVLDSTNDNLQNSVKVTGDVDTTTAGTYKIIYSVQNDLGVTITAERTVIVMDSDISLNYDSSVFSNDKVTINIGVINNYFDYILLPNGNKDPRRTTTYDVTTNGTYKFAVYSKDGSSKEKEITINNIDKQAPTGSCTAKYNNGNYTITANAKDDISGIKNFSYYLNNKLAETTNKTNLSVKASNYTESTTINNIYLSVTDNANNSSRITCTVDNSAYKPPSSSSKSSSKTSSSSSSKSSSKSGSVVDCDSTSASNSCRYMTAYYNGRKLSYDELITMSVGQTITIKLNLSTNCGTIKGLTRTTADGQSNWRNYFEGSSNPSVPHNSGMSVSTSTYNWIIKATKKTNGSVTLSQTAEYSTDKFSCIKCFYRINVKVQ